ncbi:putative photosynthetic complex assembly protein PuhE [Nevskia sp.]|uniref:putative photosynthetic complex assembly protein PuhE n=1 Tax=Nevskia sp. TaxID=1929292 RepID=UPI0025CCAB3A|nr:putative photosynthetic complex assembly protein PuhE [Nevskia sp.]
MTALTLTILYTLFVWWFSTGAILWLDGLPRRTYRTSLGAASVVALAALYALDASADDTSARGAVIGFTASLMIWGWLEMSFLMGFITGPRRTPCPLGASGWKRARYALEAVLHHELALLAGGVIVTVLSADAANQTGLWTYMILWALRTSAKLNVFLGVRNLSEAFLPDHLRYLQSYFTRRPMNLLFPFTVIASTTVATLLWRLAVIAPEGSFEAVSLGFLATLLSLAVLEHWFLVLPIPADVLWKWGMGSRQKAAASA